MKTGLIKIRNTVIRKIYVFIVRPILFQFDPEKVHDNFIRIGSILGKYKIGRLFTTFLFSYKNTILKQNINGIAFDNPIGLAAGFDKNAEMTDILKGVGFGFGEIGSITGEPCEGNPKPRLWRLKKSKGLLVYYGLKNDGCEKIAKRLENKKFRIPVGVNIAKTNCKDTVEKTDGIKDYVKAFKAMKDTGDYMVVNISCPNAFGGQPFTKPEDLEDLLSEIDKIQIDKPIFVKINPDLNEREIDDIIMVCEKHKISGFICTNLTKSKNSRNELEEKDLPEVGGISGKPLKNLSTRMINYVYNKTQGKYIIIGCGGIFNAEDAYEKIKAGASLVQMITGMVYQGPQVISEINLGLAELLKKDGYSSISRAVGSENAALELNTQ